MSEEKKPRRIRYALENDRTHATAAEDMDNPMSPNFLGLDARNSRQQSRWWALHGKKVARADSGVMEADLGVI